MSQRVWTCPCGWKTTAENAMRGVTGDPPPHCRRCGKNAFAVASEKHPKVTHVCKDPDCRQDFLGHVGAKFCDRCRPKHRGQAIWEGRRKYVWTPERDQILRDEYKHNATELANRFGWPKWVVVKRAGLLGLCRVKEKPWTKGEDAFITEYAGVHTPHWMARQLRTRTETAIVVRLKRLNISRRIHADGLTMGQLEQAIGVDHRQIVGWWRSGRLKGTYRDNHKEHERYEFQERDIAEFLLKNPSLFRLDRVDQAWFMGLMRDAMNGKFDGVEAAGAEEQPAKRKQAHAPKAAKANVDDIGELTLCIGVDAKTPCQLRKQVLAKPHIPARCPDCRLEIKRRHHREEMERLQRIRASAPPRELEEATA